MDPLGPREHAILASQLLQQANEFAPNDEAIDRYIASANAHALTALALAGTQSNMQGIAVSAPDGVAVLRA